MAPYVRTFPPLHLLQAILPFTLQSPEDCACGSWALEKLPVEKHSHSEPSALLGEKSVILCIWGQRASSNLEGEGDQDAGVSVCSSHSF